MGYWHQLLGDDVSVEAEYLSPSNTLVVLSYAAVDGEASAEEWDAILECNLESMDEILDTNNEYDNIYEYLVAKDPDHWRIQDDGSFDFSGSVGITPEYLNEIFGDFPPRELTEEEIVTSEHRSMSAYVSEHRSM